MTRRVATAALLVLLSCLAVAVGGDEGPALPRAGDFARQRRAHVRALNDRVRRAMEQPMGEVRFDEVGLAAAIDLLRGATRANLFVDWKALEAAGIERTAPVSVRLTGVSFAKVLGTVLRSVGGDTVKLAYTIDEGVIMISIAGEVPGTELRVYDVRDIVITPAGELDGERLEALNRLIVNTIDPDSWRDNGGNVGSFRNLEGQLLIIQTDANHALIDNALTQARRLLGIPGEGRHGE